MSAVQCLSKNLLPPSDLRIWKILIVLHKTPLLFWNWTRRYLIENFNKVSFSHLDIIFPKIRKNFLFTSLKILTNTVIDLRFYWIHFFSYTFYCKNFISFYKKCDCSNKLTILFLHEYSCSWQWMSLISHIIEAQALERLWTPHFLQ